MHGEPILFLEPADVEAARGRGRSYVDLDHIRPDLAEVIARHANTLDERTAGRGGQRRRKTGQRTARENIAATGRCRLLRRIRRAGDRRPAPAAGARRPDRNTPADGLVTGVGTVNADKFGADAARCMVIAYDYTVLAGTQGT